MSEYAVIRGTGYKPVFAELAPEYVMQVDRQTDTSLIGVILDDSGNAPIDRFGAYETRPSYEKVGWRGTRGEMKRPGRVALERLICGGFQSFKAAKDALSAAKAAWKDAKDLSAYEKRMDERASIQREHAAEAKRLEDEMRQRLADLSARLTAAERAEGEARRDAFQRMTAAAVSAATPSP